MSDKAALLREANEAYSGLRQAIEGLTDEAMREIWLGSWGVREILIHMSGWHGVATPAFGRIVRGEAPLPAGTYDDFDAWNARFVLQKSGVKTADVLDELDLSHAAFVAAAGALPETYLELGGAARELFENNGPGHYREHSAQIREWRQRAGDR